MTNSAADTFDDDGPDITDAGTRVCGSCGACIEPEDWNCLYCWYCGEEP